MTQLFSHHRPNQNPPKLFGRWVLIGIFGLAAIIVTAQPVLAIDAANPTGEPKSMTFTPELALPGQFEGDIPVDESLAAKYIRAVYVYLVWAIGIIAAVMITYGGIKWVAAAGNPTTIKDAKDIITNAVIAIIIALTSVLLLNLINPDLLKLNLAKLNSVKGIILSGGSYYADGDCYQELACPSSYQRVVGGLCDATTTAAAYAPIDKDPCGNNVAMNICCQSLTDPKLCFGFSALDKKQIPGTGTCKAAAAPTWSKSACRDQTSCGSYNKANSCVGTYCANGACELSTVDESGKCWPADSVHTYACLLSSNDKPLQVNLSSQLNCGQFGIVIDPKLGSIQAAGTNPAECGAGKYCQINMPPTTNGDTFGKDVNDIYCNLTVVDGQPNFTTFTSCSQ
jgi:hypothetical protein